ncbi:MAG: leucine-rich repeat protein, partial [Sodaliphilus sp.]|nr:leucine-rich repeat protein [Sodaliphilus sp.]
AFAGCKSLATLRWSDATQLALIGSEAFIATQMSDAALAKFQKLSTIGAWAYAGTPVEEVTLPESVKEVGDGAFFYATHVTNLVLPSKVTKVAPYLTAGTNVANTNIWGNDITRIGDFALYNLSDIDRLTIPSQVTYIGTKAMAGMTGLTRITAKPTTVPLLGHDVWAGVEQKEVELAAASANYLSAMQWNEFKITKRYIMGDANSDDLVNVTDITTIINYILGNNPENFNFDAADCTPDSIINVSDITMVINLILSGSTTEVVGEWEVNTEDNVNIDDFNLAPGETRSIDVKLCNSQAYTALQFDLRLPEGLEIVSIGKADRIANHNIHSGTLPDGTVRFIAYNMQNADIKGNDGAIITLVVKASQALAPNDAIEVSHTVLATASDESFFAPVTVARVGNTTGVADVSQSAAKVYSQAGRVVIESAEATTAQLIAINGISINLAVEAGHNEYEAPAQGVYIVRIAGKSHKLVVRN